MVAVWNYVSGFAFVEYLIQCVLYNIHIDFHGILWVSDIIIYPMVQGFGISIDIDIPADGKLVFDHRVSYIKVKLSVRYRVQTNIYIYIFENFSFQMIWHISLLSFLASSFDLFFSC